MDQQRRIDVNWVQVLAGALAATSSAVFLSTVGVAGTIIGAAVGSVAATVGGAVYSYYLAASRERLLAARSLALARVARAQAKSREAPGSPADMARVDQETDRASEVLREAEADLQEPVSWRRVLGGLPWKRIAWASLGIFVLVMAAILVFELMAGRAVSTYTGGSRDDGPRTTIPLGGRDRADETPKDVPSPSGTTSEAPSDGVPTEATPEVEPSIGPSTEATETAPPGTTPEEPTSAPTTTQPSTEPSGSSPTVAPGSEPSP